MVWVGGDSLLPYYVLHPARTRRTGETSKEDRQGTPRATKEKPEEIRLPNPRTRKTYYPLPQPPTEQGCYQDGERNFTIQI